MCRGGLLARCAGWAGSQMWQASAAAAMAAAEGDGLPARAAHHRGSAAAVAHQMGHARGREGGRDALLARGDVGAKLQPTLPILRYGACGAGV